MSTSRKGTAAQEWQSAGPTRITVNLAPKAAAALDQAVKLTGDTKTDTINRALQIYAYLERVAQDGGTLYTRLADSDELERLYFV
ncbi:MULTISPECIES: hypothetical protein [Streptomyces]|uniref:Ribbon-helix-helix protein, copG family n=1 Tax=Streptomyces yunnanensis TaxID=156453 RepID=A0A9X8N451_9ACTN|nr:MULTISPECIES: hypothetical protein [Streptomyces]AJC61074.1 hypothetical protein GZL_08546 [Streptomyces sp. 769]QRX90092.1 hypothetical protein JNO44_03740 [Streptomyces noursei]UJB40024.1 hypothetical protein HRD51_03185 [Streptomyces sp. A1-5]WEB44796.1 hypothetical protein MOV08_39635 [Streptomyces yunnanensis]SHM90402.1 hypothetical protein SAMN05216268_11614 [Streptomyces yunnanensis]